MSGAPQLLFAVLEAHACAAALRHSPCSQPRCSLASCKHGCCRLVPCLPPRVPMEEARAVPSQALCHGCEGCRLRDLPWGPCSGEPGGGAGLAQGKCCPHPVSLDGQVLAIRKDPKLEGALSGLVPQPAMRLMQRCSPLHPALLRAGAGVGGCDPMAGASGGSTGQSLGPPAAPTRRGGEGWCDGSCCFRMVPGVPCSPGHTAATWGKPTGGPMSGTWVSATALVRDGSCLRLWHRRHGENHVRAEGRSLHGEMWPE